MYYLGICDDGRNICKAIEKMISRYMNEKELEADIMICYSGEALCEYLKQDRHIDILFLDIELFKLSGIKVGSFVRNQLDDREMQIIYISGKSSYAPQLFKTQPTDFLLKPIRQPQIDEVLSLAIKIITNLS